MPLTCCLTGLHSEGIGFGDLTGQRGILIDNCDTGSVTVVKSLFYTSELTFSISYMHQNLNMQRDILTLLSSLDMEKKAKV